MELIAWIAAGLFCLGYVFITLEQRLSTHKSAIALLLGGVLWVLAALNFEGQPERLDAALGETGAEIFGIVAFLLAALAIIEILVHYRFFDLIRTKLLKLKVGDKEQFLVLMAITFFLSAILDNIAITIAMLQIARRFFTDKNLIIAAAGIVITANAGGSWSPIGDITTILLWLADKFTALEIILYGFAPAAALALVANGLLYRKMDDTSFVKREADDMQKLSFGEKLVVTTALSSFLLPLAMSTVGLPPYMGLLLGLGLTWSIIELAKHMKRLEHPTHMSANIDHLLGAVDLASIKYIMGILLAVMALSALGVLSALSQAVVGSNPTDSQLIWVNIGLGFLSGIVDNASLVAIAIEALPMDSAELWALTAIAAGNGGSLMVIGSAAGIVAAGNLKHLTVGEYFKIATFPVLLGLLTAFAVWYAQYVLL